MSRIKYSIPLIFNPETGIGLINCENSFIKSGVLYNIFSYPKIGIESNPLTKLKVIRFNCGLELTESTYNWAFPISYRTLGGLDRYENNINTMNINVFNDIRRIIKLVFRNEDGSEYNALYIDPPFGQDDVNLDSEYKFELSTTLYNGCITAYEVSVEGQILFMSTSRKTQIYGFYQLGEYIVVFSNTGIFYLRTIDNGKFFEVVPITNISSFDVKSITYTYGTEDLIYFVYGNELYAIVDTGRGIGASKLGGFNIISKLLDGTSNFSVYSTSSACCIVNNDIDKSLIYDNEFTWTGVIKGKCIGIDIDKFLFKEIDTNYYNILSISNELNDNVLKNIRQIVVSGMKLPNYASARIMSDITKTEKYLNYHFNSNGIAYCNHVCSKLDFVITINKNNFPQEFEQIRNIDIYYEYIENKQPYRAERAYQPAFEVKK